ncbi:MAG: hypothetical protein GKS05_09655 [Nitrospirales bacterium]|nr:hypothetical protein [Nitrospirales bacterium]
MRRWIGLLLFVGGLVVGLNIPTLAPQYLTPYLPKVFQDTQTTVTGVIVRKQSKADRLLLTISTPQGALLATFKQRITEIDLLVDQGDEVTIELSHTEPFIEDPPIRGVMKPHANTPLPELPVPETSSEDIPPQFDETPL